MRDQMTERAAISAGRVATGPDARQTDGMPVTAGGDLWAVVLAGGQGVRLRPLIRRIYGDDRPKQFASLVGARSLLRQTIDRIGPVVSPNRTVTVIRRNHADYLPEALGGAEVRYVLRQPEDRGTAAGVLFPVHWIHHRDPHAVVAVFPSDHFVHEEQRFSEHVGHVVDAVRRNPDWVVLLGAAPTDPDPDYGWIEPGEPVGYTAAGDAISTVRRFWEKPSSLAARGCLEQGWLWNTFVFVASAALLLDLARQFLPRLDEGLSLMTHCWDTEKEAWALEHAYSLAPSANLSRCILERRPSSLVVSRLPAVTWSDWGRPERVIRSLKTAHLLPSWFAESDLRAEAAVEPRQGALVSAVDAAGD
jgi:mannose-1-phosphate guanylyltransferase